MDKQNFNQEMKAMDEEIAMLEKKIQQKKKELEIIESINRNRC